MSDVQKIPVYPNRLAYRSPVRLEGTRYMFRFRYKRRSDRWYFDIETMGRDPIVRGIKVVSHWPLLQKYADDRLPDGEIICYRKDGLDKDPSRDEFGRNAVLLYFPSALIPEEEPRFDFTVRPLDDPFYRVDITDTNSPVQEEEDLEVTTRVQNVGDIDGTQQNILLFDVDDQLQASESVTLEHGESNTFTMNWTTRLGNATTGTVRVTSDDDDDEIEVTIDPAGTGDVTGTITGSTIPENEAYAEVSAFDIQSAIDSQGQYLLEDVSEGSREVEAFGLEYHPDSEMVNVVSSDTVTQDFDLDPVTEWCVGIVTDAQTGEPIEDVFVEVIEDNFDELGQEYEPDETNFLGWYKLNTTNGIFRVEWSKDGYETREEVVGVNIDGQPGERFDIELEPES